MTISILPKIVVLLAAASMFGVTAEALADEPADKKEACKCCEEKEQEQSRKRKRVAKPRLSGDCVCPQWKYATFPTYYSYYSQLCPSDGGPDMWVAYDTATDHGEYPNSSCNPGMPPECDNCVNVLFAKTKLDRNRGSQDVSSELRRTIGIKNNVKRDYLPDNIGNGVTIERSFIAKVLLPQGGRVFVKLFVITIDPLGPTEPVTFGHGVQTVRTGGHDIVIESDDVNLVEDGEPTTKCFRFETDDASVVSERMSFQVITRRAIPTGP